MTSATDLQSQQPIRGGPFTINLLNTILAFAAADERDVFLCYTLVCKQWREAELFYCREMWRNLALKLFHGKLPRLSVWSHWAYTRRRRATATFNQDSVVAGDLDEIEDCGLNRRKHLGNDDDNERVNFDFRCPLLFRHLRILENEVVPGNPDRNTLFCDVCEKRVYPIASRKEIKNLPNDEDGRVCVIMKKSPIYNRVNKFLADMADNTEKKSRHYNDLMTCNGDVGPFNIAIITTEPPPPPEGYDCKHGFSPSGRQGLAEQFLSHFASSVCTTQKVEIPEDDENQDDDTSSEKSQSTRVSIPVSIISKELAMGSVGGYPAVHVRIVRIPPPPADLNAETAKTKYASMHPALPDNVLGKNKMPTKNGWNLMFAITPDVSEWFTPEVFPEGARALLHLFYKSYDSRMFLRNQGQNSSIAGFKKNRKRNSSKAALETQLVQSLFTMSPETPLNSELTEMQELAKAVGEEARKEAIKAKNRPLNSYFTEEEKKKEAARRVGPRKEGEELDEVVKSMYGLKEKIADIEESYIRQYQFSEITRRIRNAVQVFVESDTEDDDEFGTTDGGTDDFDDDSTTDENDTNDDSDDQEDYSGSD